MRNAGIALAAAAALGVAAATPVAESERKPEPREPKLPTGPNGIPDRVSLEADSPFYFPDWSKLGVRQGGGECRSVVEFCVVEFCVSEGWTRNQIFHGGRPKMERGKFVTVTRRGPVEPYWRS